MAFDALPATQAFPPDALDVKTELNLAGTWTDITAYVLKNPVVITRGHPDESTTTTASTLTLTLANDDSRFTATNPTGAYYPNLIRNTPIRVSVPEGASYLRLEGDASPPVASSYASTPASGSFPSGAVDVDIQLDLTLDNWRANTQTLASWWASASNERGWFIALDPNGFLQWWWSSDGTTTNRHFVASSAFVPYPPLGRLCLRVTYAHATGNVNFYTAPAGNLASASWTALGSTVTGSATSLFASTAALEVGWCSGDTDFGNPGILGKIHAFRFLSGIAGTAEASPDFTAQTAGATSFTDAQSNTWTIQGTSEISNRKYRFHGEAAAWPMTWSPVNTAVEVSLQAGGLLRRLGRATEPLNSAVYRAYVRMAGSIAPVAYWPCEDAAAATQIASGLPGGSPMIITGSPNLASFSGFTGSASIPVMWSGTSGTLPGTFIGNVGPWNGGGDNVVRFLMAVPAAGDVSGATILRVNCAGTANVAWMDLTYTTASNGSLNLTGYSSAGVQLFSTGNVGTFGNGSTGVNGFNLFCAVSLQSSGTTITYRIQTLAPGSGVAQDFHSTFGGTLPAIGTVTSVVVNPGSHLQGTAIGQITVHGAFDAAGQGLFDMAGPLIAWTGETAAVRFQRLCTEESVPVRLRGVPGKSVAMGTQTQQTLAALLQECADTEHGIWTEPRQVLGWGFRTAASCGNQTPAVTYSYASDHLAWPLSPTEDDQIIANDITVTNTDGTSARAVQASGPLSIQAPPNGVGRYDTSVSVNAALDNQLADEAGLNLAFGTVAEPRYPAINIDLGSTGSLASLYYATLDTDLGDRVQVTTPPAWLPPFPVDQIIQGATETLFTKTLTEQWAGNPATPWNVAISDDLTYGRADTDGSTLNTGISSGATSMLVNTTTATSPLWTTSAGDFPLNVIMGGEEITVTNITGGSSPQTFTITRSVNGVVKSHLAGEDVRLYPSPMLAMTG